jgi:hypothetical protein
MSAKFSDCELTNRVIGQSGNRNWEIEQLDDLRIGQAATRETALSVFQFPDYQIFQLAN